jgi:DNA-binding NarL/FixJ family response regulator
VGRRGLHYAVFTVAASSLKSPIAALHSADSPAIGVVAADPAQPGRLAAALREAGVRVAATAGTVEELPADGLDIVVLRLSERRGPSQLRALAKRCPHARIVCIAPAPSWKATRALLRDGATAIVAEEDVACALGPALVSAHAGQLSLPSRLRREIAHPVLSVREKQMLGMVVMGFSNAEIARKLYVAESTVKSHLSSAFAKLGVRSRNEATALILDPESGLGAGILTISGDDDSWTTEASDVQTVEAVPALGG